MVSLQSVTCILIAYYRIQTRDEFICTKIVLTCYIKGHGGTGCYKRKWEMSSELRLRIKAIKSSVDKPSLYYYIYFIR